MATLKGRLAGIVEELLEWAARLRARVEKEGLKPAAEHARLVEAELRLLARKTRIMPPEVVEEKLRLILLELSWLEDEILATR